MMESVGVDDGAGLGLLEGMEDKDGGGVMTLPLVHSKTVLYLSSNLADLEMRL
jgi:hypothetical protein